MLAGKLASWLAVLVVFGQLQCAAACVGDLCLETNPGHAREDAAPNLPPCHRSHSPSGKHTGPSSGHTNACSHEATANALLAPVLSLAAPAAAEMPADFEPVLLAAAIGLWPEIPISSPPVADLVTSAVLRI